MKLSFSCYSCFGIMVFIVVIGDVNIKFENKCIFEKGLRNFEKINVALMGLCAFSLSSLHTSILTWNALCENGEEYGKKLIALF